MGGCCAGDSSDVGRSCQNVVTTALGPQHRSTCTRGTSEKRLMTVTITAVPGGFQLKYIYDFKLIQSPSSLVALEQSRTTYHIYNFGNGQTQTHQHQWKDLSSLFMKEYSHFESLHLGDTSRIRNICASSRSNQARDERL